MIIRARAGFCSQRRAAMAGVCIAFASPNIARALSLSSSLSQKNFDTRLSISSSSGRRSLPVCASSSDDSTSEGKGIFSFVTDNPSSKNAIQLPNTPAQDGNLGQMITEIENKGREYGSYKRAGEYSWFVRETGAPQSKKGTVILLHGAPTQSYSYRVVLEKMAELGYHCYAPDWLGYGFSERPQPVYDFPYTEEAYHKEFDKLLSRLGVDSPFFLVTQGFIVGSYGLTWALKNPQRISKLVILNGPLTTAAPVPWVFQQMRFPLVGEFTCQNAMIAERFVEGGSTYVLDLNDADVYRLPYLDSSDPGFALLESTRKAPLKDLMVRIEAGFSSGSWDIPTLVAWGLSDKYLPSSEAESFSQKNSKAVQLQMLEGAGHIPQEDWPEKVVDALRRFF